MGRFFDPIRKGTIFDIGYKRSFNFFVLFFLNSYLCGVKQLKRICYEEKLDLFYLWSSGGDNIVLRTGLFDRDS